MEMLSKLLENEELMVMLLGVLGSIVAHFWRQFRKDKADADAQAFDLAVKLAYDGVTNLKRIYPSTQMDKVARGLELFTKAFAIERGRAPSPAEVESAKLHFDAIHSQEPQRKQLPPLAALDAPAGNAVAPVPQMPLGL